jgi:hypothetical protein
MYREGMLQELAPAGAVEAMLAERVVGLAWRLRRAERLQNAAFAALDEGEPTPLLEARHEEWKQLKGSEWERGLSGVIDEDAALGKVVVEDFGGARVLDRLLMYERRIESSLYRTMAELRREREEAPRAEGGPAAGEESSIRAKLASFGANTMPEGGAEEVSSLKGQVSSGKGPVSGDGSDFPLQTSNFELAKITPYGVTTNPPVAGGRRGQDAHATGALHVGQSHGRDARATGTPCGVAANPPVGGVDRHSHIPSFHHSSPVLDVLAEGESCETKPIRRAFQV